MSEAPQVIVDSSVRIIEFTELTAQKADDRFEKLVATPGVVYVTSITRDECSGCIEQKPLFRELAARIGAKKPGLFSFTNVHVHYRETDESQSREAKRILRHAAYPTYMIHVRSKFGPLEIYRAIYPTMEELEKQVTESLDLAEYYKTDSEKTTN